MKDYSVEEIKQFVEEVWKEDDYEVEPMEVEVSKWNECVRIRISKMYRYVPVNYTHLNKLAVWFQTTHIEDERSSSNGCETCDYGSSYELTLKVSPGAA